MLLVFTVLLTELFQHAYSENQHDHGYPY